VLLSDVISTRVSSPARRSPRGLVRKRKPGHAICPESHLAARRNTGDEQQTPEKKSETRELKAAVRRLVRRPPRAFARAMRRITNDDGVHHRVPLRAPGPMRQGAIWGLCALGRNSPGRGTWKRAPPPASGQDVPCHWPPAASLATYPLKYPLKHAAVPYRFLDYLATFAPA
jgi:hypothetical protein